MQPVPAFWQEQGLAFIKTLKNGRRINMRSCIDPEFI